jgi:hypothetical protein
LVDVSDDHYYKSDSNSIFANSNCRCVATRNAIFLRFLA